MHMTTRLGRMVTYHEGLPPIKSNNPLIKWSHDKQKTIISPLPQFLSRVVAYLEVLLSIKSYNILITWSCKIM